MPASSWCPRERQTGTQARTCSAAPTCLPLGLPNVGRQSGVRAQPGRVRSTRTDAFVWGSPPSTPTTKRSAVSASACGAWPPVSHLLPYILWALACTQQSTPSSDTVPVPIRKADRRRRILCELPRLAINQLASRGCPVAPGPAVGRRLGVRPLARRRPSAAVGRAALALDDARLKGLPLAARRHGAKHQSSSVSCRCSAVASFPRRASARCMGFSSSLGVSPALQAQGLSALRRTDQGLLSGGQVQRQWKTTTCPPGRALFWTIGGGAPAPRSARRSAARSGCSATRAGTRSGGSAGCGSGTRTARGRAGRAARRWAASRSPRGGRTGGRAYRGAARGSGEA